MSHSVAHLQLLQREFRWFEIHIYACCFLNHSWATTWIAWEVWELDEKYIQLLHSSASSHWSCSSPGGANDKGSPILVAKLIFQFFLILEALCFTTSVVALLVFLSILLPHYVGRDFVHSTSRRILVGWMSLFLAIANIIVASRVLLIFPDKTSLKRFRYALPVMVTFPCLLFLMFNCHFGWSMLQLAYGRKFQSTWIW